MIADSQVYNIEHERQHIPLIIHKKFTPPIIYIGKNC